MLKKKHSIADIVIVQNFILGKIVIPDRCVPYFDMNGDGKITSMDYVLMVKEVFGNADK